MVSTTTRFDPKVKKQGVKMAKWMGVSFNDLINILLKKAIREGGVDLRQKVTENGFTPEFEESVLKAEQEGGEMSFDSINDLIEYAKNED